MTRQEVKMLAKVRQSELPAMLRELRALKRLEKAARASVINHALCSSYKTHRCALCRALAALKVER